MATLMLPSPTNATVEEKAIRVLTDAVPPGTIQALKLISSNWILAYVSRHITVNTDGEEETEKSRAGRGHWHLLQSN